MQNEEEAITIGSIVSIGRYEILYATAPYYDEKNGEVEDIKTIQYLNNAHVKYNEVYLHYEIDWKEKGKSINAINFAMPKEKRHLQDVFITIPHGLIKKNRTGIGATTLEINSPRNSIIVVPTRALAYGKAISSKIEGESDKYRVLYVGGDITGFVVPEISDYLMDSSIQYKKFIVVADSLPRLLHIIGKEHYKDYFLMIDEIDSYQYDCNYRPNMENVMDYYFQFPISHRCLVSATIGEFSNKDIPLDIRMQTDEDFQEATMLQREDLIAKLQEEETIEARERLARNMMMQRCSRQNSLFLEHFVELQKYIPFDLLIEKLGEYDNNVDYNRFYNYVIFWTLENAHPLKVTIQEHFPINELFTGTQLTEKFNIIYSGFISVPLKWDELNN